MAAGLRLRGVDVSTAEGVGLLRARDERHLAFALAEQRVVVTHDADFLRLHAQGVAHAGIAYCHSGLRSIGQIVAALVVLWESRDADSMRNQVEFI